MGKLLQKKLEIFEYMEEIRRPIINLHDKIKGNVTVKTYCIALYEFLLEINAFETMDKWLEDFNSYGLQDKIKEYTQVPSIVMDMLDQAVEVLGDEEVDLKIFSRILISGFEEKEIGVIPMALDQVNIGDIARIKERCKSTLYSRS